MKNYENTITASTEQTVTQDKAITVKFGKINCIVRERFAEQGKEIDEILEWLIVEKCKQSA